MFTAENWGGRLRVASGIDGTVTNCGVRRYHGMAGRHLEVDRTAEPDPRTVFCSPAPSSRILWIAEAARTTVDPDSAAARRRLRQQPGRVAHELELELRAGEPVAVEKVAALVTSRDVAISEPATAAVEPPHRRAGVR